MSLAKNVEFLRHFPKLNGFNGLGIYGRTASPAGRSPLVEISGFGTNPGALKMFAYVPESLPRAPALVVPGQPDDSIGVTFGYGRTQAGRLGTGAGFDAYATAGETRVVSTDPKTGATVDLADHAARVNR
mgnify:CR=1 FL=1